MELQFALALLKVTSLKLIKLGARLYTGLVFYFKRWATDPMWISPYKNTSETSKSYGIKHSDIDKSWWWAFWLKQNGHLTKCQFLQIDHQITSHACTAQYNFHLWWQDP